MLKSCYSHWRIQGGEWVISYPEFSALQFQRAMCQISEASCLGSHHHAHLTNQPFNGLPHPFAEFSHSKIRTCRGGRITDLPSEVLAFSNDSKHRAMKRRVQGPFVESDSRSSCLTKASRYLFTRGSDKTQSTMSRLVMVSSLGMFLVLLMVSREWRHSLCRVSCGSPVIGHAKGRWY